MYKYVLEISGGGFEFVTASSKDEAYEKAHKAHPFKAFISCEIYYEI